jgi:hypothetical protein
MDFFDLDYKMVVFRAFRRDGTPGTASLEPDAAISAQKLRDHGLNPRRIGELSRIPQSTG